MSVLRGAGRAGLIALLLWGKGAAACEESWFSPPCRPEFPPMVVPPFDPERGPIWTNNGWSHPQAPVLVPPPPHPPAAYGPGLADRPEAAPRTHDDGRRPLK
jgi:hypothetical protein